MRRFHSLLLAALAALWITIAPAGAALDISPADGLPDIWEYVQGASGLSSGADDDGDGQTNLAEAVAGTNPRNSGDVIKIKTFSKSGSNVTVVFPAVGGKKYEVQGTANLTVAFTPMAGVNYTPTNQPTTDVEVTAVVAAGTAKFFRVVVSDLDSDSDGLTNYEERMLGLNANLADSNGDGTTDLAYVTAQLALPATVSIRPRTIFASEDGPSAGTFEISRARSLFAITVPYSVSGTATPASDYIALPGSVTLAVGETSRTISVNPNADATLEGSESVTVTLTPPPPDLSSAYTIGNGSATVIIEETTAPTGSGLLARYYDHANTVYAHAANFGDAGNYAFTRGTPTNTGTIVVTPTTGNISAILSALAVGNQVKLTFLGGNLNNALYNHANYSVTAKTATTFTVSITAAAALPTNSSSTCNFSIQSFPHPAVIERVDPTVNFDWQYGTPNGVVVSPGNSPENYSATWDAYLQPSVTGDYTFQLDADDKARVLLDTGSGLVQLLEHGWDGPATVGTFNTSALINLTATTVPAQRYHIRVEHVETTGDARCRLQWKVPGTTAFANIPQANQFTHTQALTYSYSGGNAVITPTGGHAFNVNDAVTLAFSSGVLFTPGAPSTHNNIYTITAATGTTFTVAITGFPITVSGAATTAGSNVITVPSTAGLAVGMAVSGTGLPANEFITALGIGTINVTTGVGVTTQAGTTLTAVLPAGPVTGNGFVLNNSSSTTTGLYNLCYANTTFANSPGRVGVDAAVTTGNNGLWGGGTPDVTLIQPETFSIRWTGQVQPQFTEEYTFVVHADDGCHLMINGQLQEMKTHVSTDQAGSTYAYDNATGDAVITYGSAVIVPSSFVVGETVRLNPTTGNLNYSSGSTYSYDSVSGDMVVDYSAMTNFSAGGFLAGQTVFLDPQTGNLSALASLPYVIMGATPTTFTVSVGAGLFVTGTGTLNISDTMNLVITAATATSFTVNYGIGKHPAASAGNVSIESVNKALKDWASMGNERYVRIPMVGGVRYDIQLDTYENTSYARSILYWYSPSQPKQIIPAERLYPSSGSMAPASFVSPTDANALVGGPFSYAVKGSNGANVTLNGNPAWLTYSGGVLSGTPPGGSAGDYQILITISSSAGASTSVLNLHVDDTGATIAREHWSGIAGTAVANIPTGIAPTGTTNLSSLEGPTDFGDNYGARVRGYITAPVTGNYYFWLAASNGAELWISDDDEPVNALKRAWVTTGNTTARTWSGEAHQKSAWLALEAGHRYYVEVLHKAGVGSGDNLAVGWLKPGETGAVPSEVVPGYVLSPYLGVAPATPGTLYVATMLSQSGAITNGVGSSTLRLSEDESYVDVKFSYAGLTGPLTDWHIHNDPYLTHSSAIMYDPNAPPANSGPQPDSTPSLIHHKWTIPNSVGTLTKADVVELLKQGKAYINLHTTAYLNGEIRGNYTLANGTRSFTAPPAPPAWTDDSSSNNGAARFLAQASFGANIADITALKALAPSGAVPSAGIPNSRYNTWIENQFLLPATQHLPEVLAREIADAFGPFDVRLSINTWWKSSMSGPDQLRQRVALALSEIHVVSTQGPLQDNSRAISHFYDTLLGNAFGNFKNILVGTTLTPGMGRYLDMLGNDKPDISIGRSPNENYAREIKQLFSIGLFRMWPDGTLMLTSKDAPIDTYTQREIVGLAHTFTGWSYGYDGDYRTSFSAAADWTRPMREVPARHFTGTKRILNNEVLPGLPTVGGQPLDANATHVSTYYNDPAYQALPAQELDAVHDQLFNHPNTGPFICRQLIQRMVTSHPSRDYLYRVVQKFNDNGSGVRGDMKSVIKAILLDYEARDNSPASVPAYGKQREPMMRVANAARALRPTVAPGTYSQTGSSTITISTGTAAHGLTVNQDVFLEFTDTTGDPAKPAPTTGTYNVASTPTTTSYTILASGWITGTYNQPANSTTMTVTLNGHWLPAGGQAYFNFTSGAASGLAGFDATTHTVATSTAVDFPGGSGNNSGTTFTITGISPTSASARTGNVDIVRFSGSYGGPSSTAGTPGPITIDTAYVSAGGVNSYGTQADHYLVTGDNVFINFTTTRDTTSFDETTTLNDLAYPVVTVPDSNSFTVTSRNAPNAAIRNDNGVFIFPLKSQPLTRSGTVNRRLGTFTMDNTDLDIGQTPLSSPTVFNYFLPDYKYPGTLASQGITTPEFQTTAETTVVRHANFIYDGVFNPDITSGISSFKTGTDAMLLSLIPWMGNATTDGLGAGPQTAQRWTSNANLGTLIDHMNTLLMAGQLPAGAKAAIQKFLYQPITSISASPSNPTTITSAGHGLVSGDSITVSGVTGGTFTPSINGTFTVTVTGLNTFTVPSNFSTGTATVTAAHFSPIAYNNSSPTTTNIRDRLRAIIHLILTSPDYTIQR